jgi:MinD-like ATPase involved in chromosome partitioning or flagellar assembly
VGEPGRIQALRAAFGADARFRLVATATSPDDARAKLALEPEAALLEGTVFPHPEALVQTFSSYRGVCFVLLPLGVAHSLVEVVRALPCVQAVEVGEADFGALAGRFYEAVTLNRQARRTQSGGQLLFGGHSPLPSAAGWRAVAVWSPQGGAGKSTLATALACEAAARRLPTLLVGLGAPDPVPLVLNLKAEPNLLSWRSNPTADGLRAAVQRLEMLDVLAGFRDPLALAAYKDDALDGPGSLPQLTTCAAYAGYAVVVLDVSAQELAAAALSAANAAVLVTLATLPGVLHVAEAAHLLHDQMAGRHRIPKEAIHLVVNKVRDSTLTPQEVVKLGGGVRRDFPALAAYVPDDPQIEEALKLRRPAWHTSEPLRRAVRTLGDLLFALPAASSAVQEASVGKPARVWTLGPIRIKAS